MVADKAQIVQNRQFEIKVISRDWPQIHEIAISSLTLGFGKGSGVRLYTV